MLSAGGCMHFADFFIALVMIEGAETLFFFAYYWGNGNAALDSNGATVYHCRMPL